MRILLTLPVLVLLLAPVVMAQASNEGATIPDEGPFVRLVSGEVIEGEVSVTPERGIPEYVIVDGVSYPHFRVHSYRVEDRVYGFAHIGARRPLLLQRYSHGRATIYREVNREGSGADFFHVGDDRIQIANTRNLSEAFADNPAALNHLQRDRMLGYVGIGAFVVGTGLVLTGAAVQFGDVDSPLSGVIIAGTGVGIAALVNAIVPGARQSARRAAIREYNR